MMRPVVLLLTGLMLITKPLPAQRSAPPSDGDPDSAEARSGATGKTAPTSFSGARPWQPPDPTVYTLVEEFTASILPKGQIKIGTDLDVGINDHLMIGTDLISTALGAPTIQGKAKIWANHEHHLALGLRIAFLNKKTLLWGSIDEHFERLDARVIRPSISWTHELSPRLRLHTFWAKGLGSIGAALSEKGRRKLWETKHPGQDYETRNDPVKAPANEEPTGEAIGSEGPKPADVDDGFSSQENQEKDEPMESALTRQSLQVQSIAGLAQDRFQLTGEYTRAGGNKVLVTSRIEQTTLEQLKSSFFRLTVAHQWIWTSFQMRLGVGVQYFVMSGKDLDGERVDDSGVQPASDISFYWRI